MIELDQVSLALGSFLQALTLPFDPLLTHHAVIGSHITFEQSVWSPVHSITVQQFKAAAASGRIVLTVHNCERNARLLRHLLRRRHRPGMGGREGDDTGRNVVPGLL